VELDRRLRGDSRFEPFKAGGPELDIVVWAVRADRREEASSRARAIFTACAARDLHLALVQLPSIWFGAPGFGASGANGPRRETVNCLRSVLMKPEHEAWLDRIWERIAAASAEVLGA
jgi:hypothetical protein